MSSRGSDQIYLLACERDGLRAHDAVVDMFATDASDIDLSKHYVGPRGAQCVALAVEAAPAVRRVSFANNQLSNESVVAIAQSLSRAPHVSFADFSDNPAVSSAGGRALRHLARCCPISICVDRTGVPPALVKLVRTPTALRVSAPRPPPPPPLESLGWPFAGRTGVCAALSAVLRHNIAERGAPLGSGSMAVAHQVASCSPRHTAATSMGAGDALLLLLEAADDG
jgi:hypothetical protein